jgi:glutamate dehydrogenase (NADP+)/cyclic pyranopterin phosphate synthase/molybdopterin-guanine dinucleotide biosynthesis protein A
MIRTVHGVVLVGGRSRRMARPKQLLESDGVPLVERAVTALLEHVDRVVFAGDGPVPHSLAGLPQLAVPEELAGPLAGVLAAMRWDPNAAWVVVACDMPNVSGEAVSWLLDQRQNGATAVMPRLPGGRAEPLLAVYEPAARTLLEEQVVRGRLALRHLAERGHVISPMPPPELHSAWINVNTPEDLETHARSEV